MSSLFETETSRRSDDPAGPIWWFIPLLGVVALVLLISQCVSGVDDDDHSDEPAAVETTVATTAATTTSTTTVPTTTASAAPEEPAMAATVLDAAESVGGFATLLAAIDAAGLTDTLSGPGPFTILAPTDDAFVASLGGDDNVAALLDHPDALREILLAHVVEGTSTSGVVADLAQLTTLQGSSYAVEASGGGISIGGVAVTTPDLETANGVIHAVDGVLLPDGFDLDALLTGGTLVDVAAAEGFGTLAGLIDAAGLTDALATGGPYTIFAPTDAAFSDLPEETAAALSANPDLLAQVLQVHVVEGLLDSGEVASATELVTLQGDVLEVTNADGTITVGGAAVLQGDVAASNGVLHVVERVIVPRGIAIPGLTINYAIGLEPVNFEVGSAVITADGREVLDRAVEFLLENPVAVEIGGHTDSDGDDGFNLQLSQDRADAVRQYLIDNGVDDALLTAVGYGETQPVASNDTDEGKADNRRIEFRVLGG